MYKIFVLVTIGIFLGPATLVCSQECLPNFPSVSDGLPDSAYHIHGQLIIPQYSFPCRAVVTSWTFHMTGSVDNITELVFQVWRFDSRRQTYFPMHPHMLPPFNWRDGVTLVQENSEVVVKLNSLESRANVEPGDVVGVIIRGENVRIQFLNNLNIVTYVYEAGEDHRPYIQTDEEHYRSVAPLISAQLEINGVPLISNVGTTPTSVSADNKLSTLFNTHTTTMLPDGNEDLGIGINDDHTSPKLHIVYLIGIGVTTGIIFLMCFIILILLLALSVRHLRNKNNTCVGNEEQSIPKRTLSPGYSSENCSLSFLPIDSTSRLNLLAFRRQEAARRLGSAPNIVMEGRSRGFFQTSMEDMPDSDMYVEIPPRVDIPSKWRGTMGCTSASNPSLGAYSEPWRPPLKENSSYMILHSANPPLLHVYDEVHNSTTLRPCEYEVPAPSTPSCSSTQPTPVPHGEDNQQTDKVIYEEI